MGRKNGIKRICQKCGKEFYADKWSITNKGGKFCSLACTRLGQIGKFVSKETKERLSKACKGKKRSPETRENIRNAVLRRPQWLKLKGQLKGEKHPNWRGGIWRPKAGYIFVLSPNHPYVGKRGYIAEHRLVMEKHIGRVLLPTETVHHINGSVSDNRIENLMLFSSTGEHSAYHQRGIKRPKEIMLKAWETRRKKQAGQTLKVVMEKLK